MAEKTVQVILFEFNKKSIRGFSFIEEPWKEYLNSEAYEDRMKSKQAFGVLSHFLRKSDENTNVEKNIPNPDYILYRKKMTHYTKRLYIKDNKLWAEIVVLDPDLFSGEVKDEIQFIHGMIDSKIPLSTSVGVEAFYDPVTKKATKIYNYIGVDFTLSPDFVESKMVV